MVFKFYYKIVYVVKIIIEIFNKNQMMNFESSKIDFSYGDVMYIPVSGTN